MVQALPAQQYCDSFRLRRAALNNGLKSKAVWLRPRRRRCGSISTSTGVALSLLLLTPPRASLTLLLHTWVARGPPRSLRGSASPCTRQRELGATAPKLPSSLTAYTWYFACCGSGFLAHACGYRKKWLPRPRPPGERERARARARERERERAVLESEPLGSRVPAVRRDITRQKGKGPQRPTTIPTHGDVHAGDAARTPRWGRPGSPCGPRAPGRVPPSPVGDRVVFVSEMMP